MKHERAVVMSLSYVLGFTAAFIGFGVVHTTFEPVGEPAAVARTSLTVLPSSDTPPVQAEVKRATGVRYDENLYAIVDGEDVLIAAHNKYGTGTGFYSSVTSFELVDGGKIVSFCVFESEDAESCVEFVYDVDENAISRVTSNI